MRKLFCLLILFQSAIGFSQTNHSVIFAPFDGSGYSNRVLPTLIHFPKGYSTAKKYPLIVFLHGTGEAGNSNGSQLANIYNSSSAGGPAYFIEHNQWPDSFYVDGKYYAPVVVSPQAPGWSTNGEQANYIIRYIVNTYSIDPDRIYLTGLSAGGEGIVNLAAHTNDNSATSNYTQFTVFYKPAAMVPMSQANAASQAKANTTVADSVKAWGFGSDPADIHGTSTKYQMTYMNNAKAGFGRFTNYSGGHCCWNQFYNPKYVETIDGESLSIYQWMFKQSRNKSNTVPVPPANKPPVANAGNNISIRLPVALATLNGSGSDPDGTIASYQWKNISGPAGFRIVSPLTAVTDVADLVAGNYKFELTVTDNGGLSATATVEVEVLPSLPPVNQVPVVSAGNAQTITLPTNTLTLNGTASDNDGSIISYLWTKVSGGNATIVSPGTAQTEIRDLEQGTYVFRLTVTDNGDSTASAEVRVTVDAEPLPPANQVPIVSAGNAQTITLPTNTLTLNGTASDNDGSIISYLWTKVSGGNATIVSSGTAQTEIRDLEEGTYVFRLTVTDDGDSTASAEVQVTVNAEPATNPAPVVNAGNAQSITLPTNTLTLNGTASDNNGTIVSYVWTKVSGGNATIVSPDAAQTEIRDLDQGSYVFKLTATNNTNQAASAEVQVTVNAALPTNQVPVVNAGNAQTITLPTNTLTLNGTASDNDGTIVSYAWTKVSGGNATISSPGTAQTEIRDLEEGTYVFRLTVTDDGDSTASAEVQVTVNAAPPANQVPVVNAGNAQTITLPTNTLTLNGTASDNDGTIASYAWTKVSGGNATIVSPDAAQTEIRDLTQGFYVFRLSATDNSGATVSSDVEVTVQAASPGGGGLYVTKVACTEYGAYWLYSDEKCYVYGFNQAANRVEIMPYNLGGKKVKDISIGFNICTMIDEDGYAWVGRRTSVIPDRINADTTGAVFNNNKSIYGYFFTYVTLKNDGSLWYWGNDDYDLYAGSAVITKPIKLSPAGVTFTKVSLGRKILALTTDGRVYEWSQGNINPVIRTFPRPAIDIFGSRWDFFGALVPDATGSQTMGYPYVWGSDYQFWGGSQTAANPVGIRNLWNLTVPIKKINANQNTIAYIDSLGRLFTLGDNVQGELGIGSEWVNHAEMNPKPYDWDWGKGRLMYTKPQQVLPQSGIKWKDIFTSNVYTFYWWGLDENNVAYHWGRDKALVGGRGLISSAEATYPNGLDVLVPTARNPMQASPVVSVPFSIYKLNAGADQTTSNATVTLSATGTATSTYTITGWVWKKISGPGAPVITNPQSKTTTVTDLIPGTYQFSVQMIDNNTATISDTVKITVNAANYNALPVAVAGKDQTITLPTNTVTVNGSASYDSDGTIGSYQWTKIAGPAQFSIAAATQSQTAINNLVQGVYKFELKVTDNKSAIAKDTIQVTVNAAPLPNQPPVAVAGNNQVITLPVSSVTVNGNGSTDADGSITGYQWTKIDGPAQFTIVSPNTVQTVVNNLAQGVYRFELKVTDNKQAISRDTISITVNAAVNKAPVAIVSGNQTIVLPQNSVTVNGNNSYDTDGTVNTYQWTKIDGPAQFTIATANQSQTVINNLVEGVYLFSLQVTDDKGATAKDTLKITVSPVPVPNHVPVAIAGNAISIVLPQNSVTLNGNASYDEDGTIASYKWNKIAGPTQFTIASATQAQTLVNGLVEGVYKFELVVTDNTGAIGKDTVQVTVTAPPANQLPVAKAGNDRVITLPTNSLTLNGASSYDPDGSITTYQWNKIVGPAQFTISTPTQAQTELINLSQGIYRFELIVKDNSGAVAKDTVQVTVNASPQSNQAPVAVTGNNIVMTLPTNSVTLSGNASYDTDGIISTYLWKKISGPAQFNIVTPTQKQTLVLNLVQGSYEFELTVTDDDGATGKDTIMVIVNPGAPPANQAPKASAGNDVVITQPTSSVALLGTGTDEDGTISSYAWKQVAGPAASTIVSPTQALTTIQRLTAVGTYRFEFTVTDNKGATGKATVQVIVNAASSTNRPPVAVAGDDRVISFPSDSAHLDGTASFDPDGQISTYLWSWISGPAQPEMAQANQARPEVTHLVAGKHYFELQVKDNKGAIAKDTVMIDVLAGESYLKIYPNPATNYIDISIDAVTKKNKSVIVIMDMKGAVLYREEFQRDSYHMIKRVDVSRFIQGTYLVRVGADINTMRTAKFIKL
ncbi:MAG: hypothetical protein E6Q24_05910 [Chitinophagaceae bacterium]|nr:MAG: hypothetical protein E6Q24_05910 [Chitinophagaceae bacterium]